MQFYNNIVTLFIVYTYPFIFIDASHHLDKVDDIKKHGNLDLKRSNNIPKGISNNHQKPMSRIVNEDKESLDTYPWLAGVIRDFSILRPNGKSSAGCTGSLISKMYVLTAAHCICWFDNVVDDSFDSLNQPNSLPTLRCLPNIDKPWRFGEKNREYVNQIRDLSKNSFNKIYIVIGAKKLPKFDRLATTKGPIWNHWTMVKEAIVMDTQRNGNRIELNRGYDLGLILVPEEDRPPRPKPIAILENNSKTQHGKYDHRTGYIAGYGIKFAFGKHSDQSRGTENNPSTYSSCMTSEKGPLDSRFKYCNTKQIFVHGCNKDGHPDRGSKKYKDCESYWTQADSVIEKIDMGAFDGLGSRFSQAHRIRVYTSNPNEKRTTPFHECINMKWIRKYGWCRIADDPYNGWGICSPSCQFLGGNFAKSQAFIGNVYHEIEVSITEQNTYADKWKKICDLDDSYIKNDAEICLKAKLPETNTYQFYLDEKEGLVYHHDKQEDPGRTRRYGYLGGAVGDSGGPIWVKTETSLAPRNELIGVVTTLRGDSSKIGNKPVNTEGVIIGTMINAKIMNWIKEYTRS